VAFVIACALWWVYFAYSPDVIRGELESRSARIEVIRPVLSYGHLALVSGIVAFAAAVGRVVADPLEPLPRDTASLLFGGAALYLATFVFTRWRLFHTVGVPRLVAALVCLGLIAVGTTVPAVAAAAVLAVLLIVLNLVERKVFPKTLHPGRPTS
ncbi:MAG: low temperature requirement protein A, partial [Propionibacteriaceae bacterium]